MKKKIFALLTVWAIVFSAAGVGLALPKDNKNKSNNQLVTLLPPSDAAMAIDAKRLFGEALPQILSGNQPLWAEILGKLDEIKSRTGVDYKQFQQIAVGVSSIRSTAEGFDFEPLVLARGQFNSTALMTAAKTAAAGKFREEKIGERTALVFSPMAAIEQNKVKINSSKHAEIISKFLGALSKEMALTTYDGGTLVFGSLARVREMFESKTRIGAEVLSLVSRKPGAIVGFGALLPNGLSQFMVLNDDTFGQSLEGIRQLSGSIDVAGENTIVSVAIKTVDAAQAKNLKDTIASLQSILPGVLKGSKGEDKKVYARMLENARLAQTGNQITLDLQVPQTDLNVLVGEKK